MNLYLTKSLQQVQPLLLLVLLDVALGSLFQKKANAIIRASMGIFAGIIAGSNTWLLLENLEEVFGPYPQQQQRRSCNHTPNRVH